MPYTCFSMYILSGSLIGPVILCRMCSSNYSTIHMLVHIQQVDALRGQVSGLRDELKSSNAVTVQLQSQLQESVRQREREVHSITVERDNLHSKVHMYICLSTINMCMYNMCICQYVYTCTRYMCAYLCMINVY